MRVVLIGQVITIETQEMKTSDLENFDPDRSNWSERGRAMNNFVFVLRIFYEVTTESSEEIGNF